MVVSAGESTKKHIERIPQLKFSSEFAIFLFFLYLFRGTQNEVPLIKVNIFLGTGNAHKSDEFSERFQMAFDP